MEKKYQVFISSTFADLEEERKGVMEAIIDLGCFPAGMELFPASDKEQFEYIKSVIDESDYYVIIVAGRYGSLAEDGVSYTEKEFDYACKQGIPILAFVKKDISEIPINKSETDSDKKLKLEQFREKVLIGRLAKFWDNGEELKYKLSSSLSREMKMNPRIGWIRGDSSSDIEVYKIIENLKENNKKLQEENNQLLRLQTEKRNDGEKLLVDESKKKINSFFKINIVDDENYSEKVITSIKEIINTVGYNLMSPFDSKILNDLITRAFAKNYYNELHVEMKDMQQIILKMMALKIIEVTGYDIDDEMETTDIGKELILSMVKF